MEKYNIIYSKVPEEVKDIVFEYMHNKLINYTKSISEFLQKEINPNAKLIVDFDEMQSAKASIKL